MESENTYWQDRAHLEWLVELGATEAIQDTPVDRYALDTKAPAPKTSAAPEPAVAQPTEDDPVKEAQRLASGAGDLTALAAAMQGFEHCALKPGARNFVFSDGQPGARVMIVGEAPGRDEDRIGKPFVGRAGQLLDLMLAAIGFDRAAPEITNAVYITNVVPWRPPSNRAPDASEVAMMLPFLQRHIALADPDVVIMMGNTPCQALLGKTGITRIRGNWHDVAGKPALPMFHPAYLLRNPIAKRDAWNDLLALKSHLKGR